MRSPKRDVQALKENPIVRTNLDFAQYVEDVKNRGVPSVFDKALEREAKTVGKAKVKRRGK